MSVELLVDKYQPQTLDEYVCRDAALREKIDQWLAEGVLPHLILAGPSGTGKTSLIRLLLKLLGVPKGDILRIPASRERKIDELEEKIVSFASTWALGPSGYKYIFLDEADAMSILAQKMLRGEIENPGSLVRFLFTCNHPEKISDAIQGRCQFFNIDAMDRDEFTARVGEILVREDIEFDIEVLLDYVNDSYPNLRKCINRVEQNVLSGRLQPRREEESGTKDYIVEAVNLIGAGRVLEARNKIVTQAQLEEYPDVFRFLYRNLSLWGETQDQQDEALLAIRRGLVNHALVADQEINLAATLAELSRLRA